jgi:hypothetical protein
MSSPGETDFSLSANPNSGAVCGQVSCGGTGSRYRLPAAWQKHVHDGSQTPMPGCWWTSFISCREKCSISVTKSNAKIHDKRLPSWSGHRDLCHGIGLMKPYLRPGEAKLLDNPSRSSPGLPKQSHTRPARHCVKRYSTLTPPTLMMRASVPLIDSCPNRGRADGGQLHKKIGLLAGIRLP